MINHGKRLLFLLLLLLTLLLAVSCGKGGEGGEPSDEAVFYTVRFDSQGGTPVPDQQVAAKGKVTEPPVPTREGFIFDGWKNGDRVWYGSYSVEGDMTLTAKWISADNVFDIVIQNESSVIVSGVKSEYREKTELRVPTMIKGFPVVGVGERAFYELSGESVRSIFLPDTVTSVGESAFEGCDGISITVSGVITSLGERAFKGCDGLKAITLGEGLTAIPFEAFAGCGLTTVRLPDSIEAIDENAFYKTSLVTLRLGGGVEDVLNSAFGGCDGLKAVYFGGTEEELEQLLDGAEAMNEPLTEEAKLYLYSADQPKGETVFDGYWYYDEHQAFRVW